MQNILCKCRTPPTTVKLSLKNICFQGLYFHFIFQIRPIENIYFTLLILKNIQSCEMLILKMTYFKNAWLSLTLTWQPNALWLMTQWCLRTWKVVFRTHGGASAQENWMIKVHLGVPTTCIISVGQSPHHILPHIYRYTHHKYLLDVQNVQYMCWWLNWLTTWEISARADSNQSTSFAWKKLISVQNMKALLPHNNWIM